MGSSPVLDTSAVLALLFGEPGADVVARLGPAVAVSAVCFSETLAKAADRGQPVDATHRVLTGLKWAVLPFDAEVARAAAEFRGPTRTRNFSFADRACLATAAVWRAPVLTADREWKAVDLGVEVVLIR